MAVPIAAVFGFQDHFLQVLIRCRNQGDAFRQLLEKPSRLVSCLIDRDGAGPKCQKPNRKTYVDTPFVKSFLKVRRIRLGACICPAS